MPDPTIRAADRDRLLATELRDPTTGARLGKWACTEDQRRVIEALVEQGLMLRSASGEMRMVPAAREPVTILGVTIPVVGQLVDVYGLTAAGRQAIADV